VTAKKYGFHVGDEVRVLFQGPPGTFTLVGITGFGSANNLGGATLAVFDTATTQRVLNAEGMFDSIAVASDPGITPTALRDRIAAVLPGNKYEALTGSDAAAKTATDVKKNLGFFKIALLDVRRHRVVRGGVLHLQHVLDHRGPADPRAGAAASAGGDRGAGHALGDGRGSGGRAGSPRGPGSAWASRWRSGCRRS